jgi:hypothetical protein
VAWSRSEHIYAFGHTARLLLINIRARSAVYVDQESVEATAVLIDLLTLAEEH